MRVLICGSRTWTSIKEIAAVVEKLPKGSVVIHGGARGADLIAAACADVCDLEQVSFPVTDEEWRTIGKSAGPRRNKRMLDEGRPDFVVAFLDTSVESPGTNNMISLAESFGVRVVVIKRDGMGPETCTTCDEPYSNPPTFRARFCSNPFHCCRECEWTVVREDGFEKSQLTKQCETCCER